jgi:PAB-dependent poly(A)-specific ribonuclease subunit 2
MPYYKENLLSGWPSHLVYEVGAPSPKIDATIMANMTRAEMGFFAKNPRTRRRNQAESRRHSDRTTDSLSAPKFLSEQSRAVQSSSNNTDGKTAETMESLTDLHLEDVTRKEVPSMYGNVEIKYSKFGLSPSSLTRLQILQSNTIFWVGNSYRQFICQSLVAAVPLYAINSKHRTATHSVSVLIRVVHTVRAGIFD